MSSVTDRWTSDYLYADNYYDAEARAATNDNATVPAAQLHTSSLIRLALTILLRAGFVLVQLGSVPIENVNLILMQNVADFCCVTVMYFLTGFLVAYNGDTGGVIGSGQWIGDTATDKNEAITGWQAVVIASAIWTTAVVGRMHAVSYLLIAALLSGLVQPLVIHWAWTANGWMAKNELAGRAVSFKDYAGAAVVHVVGGLSGLIGCNVLGRRVLRLKDLDDASISTGSASTVFAGLLLVLVGLQVRRR